MAILRPKTFYIVCIFFAHFGDWGGVKRVGNSRIRHKFAEQCQEISKTEDVTKNEKKRSNLNNNQLRLVIKFFMHFIFHRSERGMAQRNEPS